MSRHPRHLQRRLLIRNRHNNQRSPMNLRLAEHDRIAGVANDHLYGGTAPFDGVWILLDDADFGVCVLRIIDNRAPGDAKADHNQILWGNVRHWFAWKESRLL